MRRVNFCQGFAYREFLIELVGEQGVRQFSEVELTQGANAVDILDVNIFGQVGDLLRVKLMPDERETGQRHTQLILTKEKNTSTKTAVV